MSKIIVIEGTDCSGKETQSKLLAEKLEEMGHKTLTLSFPMYDTPTGKIVGDCYLGRNNETFFKEGPTKIDPKVASLYYAADRKYNIDKINKYLKEDYYVILDRYTSSNMAHQGCKIKDENERFNMYCFIDRLEYWLLGLPKPDITFFLHVPLKYQRELKKNRDIIDEHEKDEEYLSNAEKTYLELCNLYNWEKIECIKDDKLRSIEDINGELINKLLEKQVGYEYRGDRKTSIRGIE